MPTDPNMEKRVTQKDIARAASLSISAVSMALRNDSAMSGDTIKRVKSIAQELGYSPDPALSALSVYRRKVRKHCQLSVIGMITNWSTREGWSGNSNQKEVILGAKKRAAELGYSLQIFWSKEDGMSDERLSRILRARGIRGIILAPFENNDDILNLQWEHFSVVTVSRPTHYTSFHHIVQNHYIDLLNCWEKAVCRGYNRIGLVLQDEIASRWNKQWEAAYLVSSKSWNAASDSIPILKVRRPNEVKEIRLWLRKHQPQAVISRCKHFLEAASLEGIGVPEDIGYISLNTNGDIADTAGIWHCREMLGSISVDILNSLIQKNQTGFQECSVGTQLDGIWKEGFTLPDRKTSGAANSQPAPELSH